MTPEQAKALRDPFPTEQIGKLPRVICRDCSDRDKVCHKHRTQRCSLCSAWISTEHIHIDYVGHADVTARLLEVDPEWGWEPLAFDAQGLPALSYDERANPVGLWIRLTIAGRARIGYGSVPSGQHDAVKVLIGDALRNAAMRFGVALDLWSKSDKADPAAENATAEGGTARRPRGTPDAPLTDRGWYEDITQRVTQAQTHEELTRLTEEARARSEEGQLNKSDASTLWEEMLHRGHEIDQRGGGGAA